MPFRDCALALDCYCLVSLVYALRALVEWQSVLSLADEARPKLLDSDPCFLVIAFSLASMPMLSGVHTVWPSRILATLQLEPGSSSERRNLNLGENFSNSRKIVCVSMYGIAALMCGPRLLCLARLDRLQLLQLAVGGAVPRSADGPPKVRPRTSCGGLPSILNDRSVDIQSRHCARHVDVALILRPQRPQTWLCRRTASASGTHFVR